jgi:CRISPR-associated DxTHG motif protein
LYHFVEFDEMLVFVTEKAYQNAFPVLTALTDERIIPVEIPIGENSVEMWQIFEAITDKVNEHDTVIFDITHSLRSIPFLVFLAAAFLKSAKQVTLEAIYYGALELQKDARGNPRPAPVIELSEFVSLIDWLNASNYFVNSGNTAPLTALLRQVRSDAAQLERERQMVGWYLARNQLISAVAVAREWLITWGLVQAGYRDAYAKENRGSIEEAFRQAGQERRQRGGGFSDHTFETGVRLYQIEAIEKALDLSNELGNTRNTLLHAGKRPQTERARTLEKQVLRLCERLNELPLPDGKRLECR